jgi:hypothetical protein
VLLVFGSKDSFKNIMAQMILALFVCLVNDGLLLLRLLMPENPFLSCRDSVIFLRDIYSVPKKEANRRRNFFPPHVCSVASSLDPWLDNQSSHL